MSVSCSLHIVRKCPLLFSCCFMIAAALLSCTKKLPTLSVSITIRQTGVSVPLCVETAVTAAEQQQGLMHRKTIPDGTGMIFIYGRDSKLGFWMKNTPHPLSIAFIDSRGTIREIFDMQPFSLETVSSAYSVRYALEVPQGYFERAGIGVGDGLSGKDIAALKERYAAGTAR